MLSKGLILCLILGFTLAQPCSMIVTIKDTGCNYNLTSLQGLNFTGVDKDNNNYYWTFCEEVENTQACSADPRTGVCQVSEDKTNAYNAGSYLNTTTVPLSANGGHFFILFYQYTKSNFFIQRYCMSRISAQLSSWRCMCKPSRKKHSI